MVQVELVDDERGPVHPRAGEVHFHGDRRSSPPFMPPRATARHPNALGEGGPSPGPSSHGVHTGGVAQLPALEAPRTAFMPSVFGDKGAQNGTTGERATEPSAPPYFADAKQHRYRPTEFDWEPPIRPQFPHESNGCIPNRCSTRLTILLLVINIPLAVVTAYILVRNSGQGETQAVSAPSPPPPSTTCFALTAPTRGTMGNCSSTLTNGSSCHFTCNDGLKLSRATLCLSGVLLRGRCVPSLTNVDYNSCVDFDTSATYAENIVPFGDQDVNGFLDMLHMPANSKINILSQTRPRSFEATELISDAPDGAFLCAKGVNDYNADGTMDFFLLGAAKMGTGWGGNHGTADVIYTSTSGSYESKTFANSYWGHRCTSADFNRDGLADVVALNIWFSDPVRVYLNNNSSGSPTLGDPISLAGSPRFAHDIAHGDFDGDGILDIAVVSSDNHGDNIYFGTGSGSFTTPLRISSGSRGAVAVCDINGDGFVDLIIGDFYSSRSLQIYINNGSGSRTSLFHSAIQIPSLETIYGVACEDIDGDGNADIVVVQTKTGLKDMLLWNSGESPYFSTSSALTLPGDQNNSGVVQLIDVDSDGLLDIVRSGSVCFMGTVGQCVEVYAPTHGSLGNCTVPMASGESCSFTCDAGYVVDGVTTCSSGEVRTSSCRLL